MLTGQLVMVKFLAVLNLLPSGVATTFSRRPSNVSVKIGESATLHCALSGFDDGTPLNVQWAREGFVFVEGSDRNVSPYAHMSIKGDELKGEYDLHIRDVRLTDNGVYECQVSPRQDAPHGLRASATLSVLVPPSNMSLTGPEGLRDGTPLQLTEGDQVSVQCTTTGSRPSPTITWMKKKGEEGWAKLEDGVSLSEELGPQGLITATASIAFTALKGDDKSRLRCDVAHAALPSEAEMRSEVELDVKFGPGIPVIKASVDGDVGGYVEGRPVEAGKRMKLRCEADTANPPASLVWFRGSVAVEHSSKHGPLRTSNEYSLTLKPEDNRAVFRCEASNGLGPPLSASLPLLVHYAPANVSIKGATAEAAGATAVLKCVTSPSYPTARIHWTVDGKEYRHAQPIIHTVANGGTISTSNISLHIPSNSRAPMDVRCLARVKGLEEKVATAKHVLNVLYPPESLEIHGYSGQPLAAGDTQTLTCLAHGGHPSPKLTWFRGSRKITENIRSEMEGEDLTGSEIRLRLKASDNRELYRCEATSPALAEPLRASTNLSVQFEPEWVKIEVKPAEGDSVLRDGRMAYLTCESAPSNPAPEITWTREGQLVKSVDIHKGSAANGGWVVRNKVHLRLRPELDGASFLCTAKNPALNKAASAGKTLDVRYAPQFSLGHEPQSLTVLENESVSLNYSVKAKPTRVSFAWYKDGVGVGVGDGRVKSGLSHSEISWPRASRTDSGLYSLVASNEEGKRNLSTNLTVTFPARVERVTSPVMVDIGTATELRCYVSARPPPVSIKWSREGFDFGGEGIQQSLRPLEPKEMAGNIPDSLRSTVSVLSLRFKSVWTGLSGLFLCQANNGLGEVATAKATLLVKTIPRIPGDSRQFRAAGVLGEEARLKCRANGVPDVQFRWSRVNPGGSKGKKEGTKAFAIDGRKFERFERKIGLLQYESTLVVKAVEAGDFGEYLCTAWNEKGKDEARMELEKAGPPSPPHSLFAHNVSEDGVGLSWSPGFDGGLPQTFLIRWRLLGHEQDPSNRIEVPPMAQSGPHTFRVRNLRPLTKYEFSVGAENSEGLTKYSDEPHVMVETTGGVRGLGVLGGGFEEGLPTLVIILIVLISVALLLLNVCLVLCLIRRQKRKKLKEKAASARLMEAAGPRPVQMFGGESGGLRPDSQSQYTSVPNDSGNNGSEDEEGAVLEASGQVFHPERISPGSQQTYLLDDPYQALVPSVAPPHLYADELRANASLQRRTAGGGTLGRGSLNYASLQPETSTFGSPSLDSEAERPILSSAPVMSVGETSLLSSDADLPPAMGPLRHLGERRYSPDEGLPTLVSASSQPPHSHYAPEVRTLKAQAHQPGRATTPVLSTFGHSAPRAHPEYADLEQVAGDLV